jgi:hypothetical protein
VNNIPNDYSLALSHAQLLGHRFAKQELIKVFHSNWPNSLCSDRTPAKTTLTNPGTLLSSLVAYWLRIWSIILIPGTLHSLRSRNNLSDSRDNNHLLVGRQITSPALSSMSGVSPSAQPVRITFA